MAARMAPGGIPERLQLCSDWYHLGGVWDEAYDRLPAAEAGSELGRLAEMTVKIIRTFRVPSAGLLSPSSPFNAALGDIAERLHQMTTPVQRHRIIDGQQDWLVSMAWETACKTRTRLPSLPDYTAQRLYTVGGTAFTVWLETLDGVEVPEEEWDSPPVRALTEIAGLIVAFDNDLYSYAKDLWYQRNRGVLPLNCVDVLAAHLGCSVPAALDQVVHMRDRFMCLFLALRSQLTRRASSELARYLAGLGHFIRANIDFGNVSARYTNPDGSSPDAVRSPLQISDAPSDASLNPVDISHIAWWWQQL
ncbi:hypothetical protein KJK32_46245 (plasmid) [Streptomyces sp. JCM17656]|nr:hypothetical protein KJK32_46245 [Streptomyces sp. JCM17656]